MKAMDEFGSVLALTTLILGLCAGVDELFSSNDAGSTRETYPGYGANKSIQLAERELADPAFSVEWAAAVLAASGNSPNSTRFAAGPSLTGDR